MSLYWWLINSIDETVTVTPYSPYYRSIPLAMHLQPDSRLVSLEFLSSLFVPKLPSDESLNSIIMHL